MSLLLRGISSRLIETTISKSTAIKTIPQIEFVRYLRLKRIKKEEIYKLPKNVAVDTEKTPIQIDLNKPQLYYDQVKELETADERVKKILSLEYANTEDFKLYEETLIKKYFRKDELDDDSLEVDIALHTVRIRRIKKSLEIHPNADKSEMHMYRMMHRREKMLDALMRTNYERYLWLKDKLGLLWEPKVDDQDRRSSSYGKLKMEIKAKARLARQAKMDALKEYYEKEKPKFYKLKEQTLAEIDKELKELGFTDFKNQADKLATDVTK